MCISWHNLGFFLLLALCYNSILVATLSLDKYHTHEEMTVFLKDITNTYPNLTSLYSIGNSTKGMELWVVQITGKSSKQQMKPNVKLIANIHGDEAVGRELLLKFIEYLVTSYNKSDTRVTKLLDHATVHILPSMNPDGFKKALMVKTGNTCSVIYGRRNKEEKDLNRNFPDVFLTNNEKVQVETAAIMEWLNKTHFVLSASLHGGELVASYPFDNVVEDTWEKFFKINNVSNRSMQETMTLWKQQYHALGNPEPSLTPDDDVFKFLAKSYAKTHLTMHKGEGCPNSVSHVKFADGITNGALWYRVQGGMQDYNYMQGCMEITLEISCCKFPDAEQLPRLWQENKEAMVIYLMQVMRGVRGIVIDKNEQPIEGAVLRIAGRSFPFYSTKTGQFWRILLPNDYSLEVSATGYEPKSVPFTVGGTTDLLDTRSTWLAIYLERITNTTTTNQPTTTSRTSTSPVVITIPPLNYTEAEVGESKSGAICQRFNFVFFSFSFLIIHYSLFVLQL